MGKRSKGFAIVLSLLMAVQSPVMAEELIVNDEDLIIDDGSCLEESSPEEDLIINEVIPEEEDSEGILVEQGEDNLISEELSEEEEIIFEQPEDDLLYEEIIEEEIEGEPFESFSENEDPLQEETDSLNEEGLLKDNEPALVGASSGQCGDNVYWILNDNGTLTISGSGDMWNWTAYWGGESFSMAV